MILKAHNDSHEPLDILIYMYTPCYSSHAGCSEADLTHQSGIANLARCTDREFVIGSSICDGVVCHNGTTEGSKAVYVCNDGFVLMEGDKATRVCQSDGSWNGSTPQCIPEGRGMCCN